MTFSSSEDICLNSSTHSETTRASVHMSRKFCNSLHFQLIVVYDLPPPPKKKSFTQSPNKGQKIIPAKPSKNSRKLDRIKSRHFEKNNRKWNVFKCVLACIDFPAFYSRSAQNKTRSMLGWTIERLRFTFTANGKRQTQVENFSE